MTLVSDKICRAPSVRANGTGTASHKPNEDCRVTRQRASCPADGKEGAAFGAAIARFNRGAKVAAWSSLGREAVKNSVVV